jgi:DNA topoisomerase I
VRLRYVSGEEPGLRRLRQGEGFRYVNAAGRPVKDTATLVRIRSLAIPPAYRDVWICATEDGHLQATGRDARGRKQYRYHPDWRAVQDATKFERMLEFGQALPRVREQVRRDLDRNGLERERVLASVVQLLERTLVRVGNGEYARTNESFGLTTLRDDHVQVQREKIRFIFRGKSGVPHDVTVEDRRLVRVVRHCLDIPGQELFRYLDESGNSRDVGSADVNAYIREISGGDFTAKDFRTWSASVLALEALAEHPFTSATQAKREVVAVVKAVAVKLSNTPAVCRKCYIHPLVIESYLEAGPAGLPAAAAVNRIAGLNEGEARLLALLARGPAQSSKKAPPKPARRKAARRVAGETMQRARDAAAIA